MSIIVMGTGQVGSDTRNVMDVQTEMTCVLKGADGFLARITAHQIEPPNKMLLNYVPVGGRGGFDHAFTLTGESCCLQGSQ